MSQFFFLMIFHIRRSKYLHAGIKSDVLSFITFKNPKFYRVWCIFNQVSKAYLHILKNSKCS